MIGRGMLRLNLAHSWANAVQNRRRTITAAAGIAFSILMVFMQLGFLEAAKRGAVALYDEFDFDVAVISANFESFSKPRTIDQMRMIQALQTEGVAATSYIKLDQSKWTDPDSNETSYLLLIGVPLDNAWVRSPLIQGQLPRLNDPASCLMDIYANRDFGDISIGRSGTVSGHNLNIVGQFPLGLSLFTEGSAIVSADQFTNYNGYGSREVSLGLIKVDTDTTPETVAAQLRADLPDDVRVFTRQALIEREQRYFIDVKPVGILFSAGVFVAFMVGVVILFQVLSTEISNRLREFATMKAMGFSPLYVYGVGINQAIFYSVLSFLPAWGLGFGTFQLVRWLSRLPMEMDASISLRVMVMTMIMCVFSAFMALRKVRNADPADLF